MGGEWPGFGVEAAGGPPCLAWGKWPPPVTMTLPQPACFQPLSPGWVEKATRKYCPPRALSGSA